jgi:hypothetical protein
MAMHDSAMWYTFGVIMMVIAALFLCDSPGSIMKASGFALVGMLALGIGYSKKPKIEE